MPTVLPAKPLVVDPDPALQDLLEAIREGGQEAYRRLLEVLRELKRLESGTAMFKQALASSSASREWCSGTWGSIWMRRSTPRRSPTQRPRWPRH